MHTVYTHSRSICTVCVYKARKYSVIGNIEFACWLRRMLIAWCYRGRRRRRRQLNLFCSPLFFFSFFVSFLLSYERQLPPPKPNGRDATYQSI